MAGLSTLRDGNGENCIENRQNRLKIRVDSVNLESIEEGKDEEDDIEVLRGLFDRILVVSIRDDKNVIKPIPPLIGAGRSIDLFRLFYLVRERGGFDSVSREKLWGLVAENLDFDFRFSALLKLIYFKYFDELDHQLNKGGECGGDLELLSIELEKRFGGLSIENPKVAKSMNYKRKSEDWQEMLIWLKQVAKKPRDLSNGGIINSCRLSENGGKKSQELALLAREAMLKRSYADFKDDGGYSSDQKKQKIQPTIYDDPASDHPDSVRVSNRVPPLVKTPKCSFCGPSSSTQNCKLLQLKDVHEEPFSNPTEPLDLAGWYPDKLPVEKQVNVGPQFQAKIPPYTAQIPNQNPNKLGTTIWQPKNHNVISSLIGKGRPEICDCPFPGSVQCVRFHTAENNLNLKHELGRAFYQWRFNQMGEMISLSWTQQEEEKFKKVITTTSLSMGKNYFPKKTRKEFLDYYFNVFLQSKRSYQNRVNPNSVDSDDDEVAEFGSVGGFYGQSAYDALRSTALKCELNEKCVDLDMAMKVKRR